MLLAAGTELAPSAGHDKIWQPGEAAGCMPDGPQLGCHHSAGRGEGGGSRAYARRRPTLPADPHTARIFTHALAIYTIWEFDDLRVKT